MGLDCVLSIQDLELIYGPWLKRIHVVDNQRKFANFALRKKENWKIRAHQTAFKSDLTLANAINKYTLEVK